MRPPRGVLLDTSVLLWSVEDSPRLGSRLRRLLESDRPIFFSSVSIAEITLKIALKKLGDFSQLASDLIAHGYLELPLTSDHALAMQRSGALLRHDPFDTLLLSQAVHEDLWFETADSVLLGSRISCVRDATE